MSKAIQVTRDSFPDKLRGFALLGIALVNVPYLAINAVYGSLGSDLTQASNYWTVFLVAALFQAKFYILFSFLFGYSASYIVRGDKKNRRRWMARSVGLLILGALHFSLLFHGDILFVYGMFGLLLGAFLFREERTLKIWAWISFAVGAVGIFSSAVLTLLGEIFLKSLGKAFPDLTWNAPLNDALASGTFVETIPSRLEVWLLAAPQGLILQGPFVFAAFLLGLLVSRKQGLVKANPVLMRRLAVWGLAVGLPLQLFAAFVLLQNELSDAYSSGVYLLAVSLNFIAAPLMSAGLVGALWLLTGRSQKPGLLGSAGKLSLTVYLSQSLIFSTLFSAWGFDLFGQLGVLEVTLIAAATWLVLACLAWAYLRIWSKGPMESLLSGFSKLLARRARS